MQRQPATRGLRKWQDRTQPQLQLQPLEGWQAKGGQVGRSVGWSLEGWSMWDAFMLMLRLLLLPCPQVVALI